LESHTEINLNFSLFINSYLSTISSKKHYDPYIKNYSFEDNHILSTLEKLSIELKPISVPTPISITEFSSIPGLISYLDNCANKGWGYNLVEQNPKDRIIEFMTQHITGDSNNAEDSIPDFNESMTIFTLFDELEDPQNVKTH
jgi:hypothetical protein